MNKEWLNFTISGDLNRAFNLRSTILQNYIICRWSLYEIIPRTNFLTSISVYLASERCYHELFDGDEVHNIALRGNGWGKRGDVAAPRTLPSEINLDNSQGYSRYKNHVFVSPNLLVCVAHHPIFNIDKHLKLKVRYLLVPFLLNTTYLI